ncbi:phosphoglycerate dehydrogenase [Mesorhizobium erdmanii]|uniref:Phosphoglycerate dehydrogenase n=2 Tax=Mesorhizobium TaxID=68287 RepID=A0A3M9X185_9HYPH|nr:MULTISPECIES: NAD(P)-dependent oxidoreductase [Mesorhizobium]RNJ41290.1 phosphoglycerate dehydrogenase [Mesorhizobium japonicum]RXT37932.1 phosphoglycerate dehydrogenase [Mesorhizobium erdmanii]
MKIACLWHATENEIDIIRGCLPAEAEIVTPTGEYDSRFEGTFSDLKPLIQDADAAIAFAMPKGLLEAAEKLKVLSWLHAGVDDLGNRGILRLAKSKGFKIANIRGANSVAVAEQAMMFMLALAKRTLIKHRYCVEGRQQFPLWDDSDRSGMLSGRTVGIIGVGQIGAAVAKRAKAFDMTVVGVRRNANLALADVDRMGELNQLHSVLPTCDYVVLAAPQTDQTLGFFGKAELDCMKNSAFLINVSRGNLIKERPLYEALISGRIGGFAADVWWQYEYGETFPNGWGSRYNIHKLPNVLCSLHEAHNADDVLQRDVLWGAQNLGEYFSGETMKREVDLDQGY